MSRAKLGRNDPCPCGSSKKYKKCHGGPLPLTQARPMGPSLHDRDAIIAAIRRGVESVRANVARYSTFDLVGWCKWPLSGVGEQFGNKLVSQYRQLAFLLSVMLETAEPQDPRAITPQMWGEVSRDLNWLFFQYGALDAHHALTDDEVAFGRAWLSKSTYLHYFNTGALATDVQLIRWLSGTLAPFDVELTQLVGFSASDAVAIYRTLARHLEERDDAQFIQQLKQLAEFPKTTGGLMSAKYALTCSELAAVAPPNATAAFWNAFAVRRGALPATTEFPTDQHHLERLPFIEVADGVVLYTVPGAALEAIALRLSSALLESKWRDKYLKRRDDFLEEEVLRVFAKFFTNIGARVFADAYLDEYQNDLVVIDGSTVLVIEAKAGFMKEPFRDIGKAHARLKQNFDRVIGEAHVQASRTRKRLLAGETLVFRNERHEVLVELAGAHVTEVLTVCVTADDFGPLARDMSLLLELNEDEIFPWAVMLNDLETFLHAFEKLKVPYSDLYNYLRDRATLHGRVESGDELELAGYFLRHRTLRPLDQGPRVRKQIDPSYSDIFDELFYEEDEEL